MLRVMHCRCFGERGELVGGLRALVDQLLHPVRHVGEAGLVGETFRPQPRQPVSDGGRGEQIVECGPGEGHDRDQPTSNCTSSTSSSLSSRSRATRSGSSGSWKWPFRSPLTACTAVMRGPVASSTGVRPVDAVGGKHLPFDADPAGTEPSHVEDDVGRVAGEREVGDVDVGLGVGGPQIDQRHVLAAVEEHAGHDFDRLPRELLAGPRPPAEVLPQALPDDRRRVDERDRGRRPVEVAQPGDDLPHPRVAGGRLGHAGGRGRVQPSLDPVEDRGEIRRGIRPVIVTPRLRSGRATVRGIAPASARSRRSPGPAAVTISA